MKKLTKNQLTPRYVAEFDTTVKGEELGYGKLTAMGFSEDLLDVIALVDKTRLAGERKEQANTKLNSVYYLVSIYSQVGVAESGEPLYERKLISRSIGEWHVADADHHENKDNNLYFFHKGSLQAVPA